VIRLARELLLGEGDATPLAFRAEGDVAIVGEGTKPIAELGAQTFAEVRIEGDVYRHVAPMDARVRLLELARDAARTQIVLRVPVGAERSQLAQVAVDLPRVLGRRSGLALAEPGDRREARSPRPSDDTRIHRFFDEETLYREIDRARLGVASRSGFTFVLTRGARREGEIPEPIAFELRRALGVVRLAEAARSQSPAQAIAAMRAHGRTGLRRGPLARARLRRAIAWVDAARGENCYRRVLMELALDHGAAEETVVFGLDVGKTGHVAFEGREELAFDVAFAIPAALP
jgi:hypothetical protein